MKYISIFHANLNYAYLTPDHYEFVIRQSYEMLIDTMAQEFSETPYVFEASGYTVDQIALRCPDVLDKLRQAIERGQCEFMGSPYAHPMLPNFPYEDDSWSLEFSLRSYQQHLGVRPASFWNPECGWREDIPKLVHGAGYRHLIGDFEAYSRSCDSSGRPVRPEIHEVEFSATPAFYNFGFKYDLGGDEPTIHFPFNKVQGLPEDALRVFLRTDRVAQFGVRYFMGMEGYSLEQYLGLIERYSEQASGQQEGALIIYADDAEYVGTNGWFRLKYQNCPDNVFEAVPDSREKLIALVTACKKMGQFTTFDKACSSLTPLQSTFCCDDDAAWHGGRASTWATTPMAKLLRPWQDMVREKLQHKLSELTEAQVEQAWLCLTNSYNSDGQWPPTLPEAPHIIHPFNYGYCFENLLQAEMIVGGVDHSQLNTSPKATLRTILGPQQELIRQKVQTFMASDSPDEQVRAQKALALLEISCDMENLSDQAKVLYPAEYTIRAEALVQARRLVGPIEIERIAESH